jgi:predicted PurR-regulated permease PerM
MICAMADDYETRIERDDRAAVVAERIRGVQQEVRNLDKRVERIDSDVNRRIDKVENSIGNLSRHLDVKVDEILKKVAEYGDQQESLQSRLSPVMWIGSVVITAIVLYATGYFLNTSFPQPRPAVTGSPP